MKKFLSILIAISLIISMLPVAFADGETETSHVETYYFRDDNFNTETNKGSNVPLVWGETKTGYTTEVPIEGTSYFLNDTYMSHGTRGWKMFYASNDMIKNAATTSTSGGTVLRLQSEGYLQISNASKCALDIAFSLQTPKLSGFFELTIKGYKATTITSNPFAIAVDSYVDGKDSMSDYASFDEVESEYVTPSYGEFTQTGKSAIYTSEGDEVLVHLKGVNNKSHKLYYFTLTQILPTVIKTIVNNTDKISFDLTDGDTANDTAVASTLVSGKKVVDNTETTITDMPVSNNFITYKSSNEAVATVAADGTITAVGGGTATIYAESSDKKYNSLNNGIAVTVTVPSAEPEEDAVADGTVSFAQTTNIDGFDNISVETVARGATVELTAHKGISGYKFIGWKRGADTSDKNAWVDIEGDTYNVWTNTYLTAIYEKKTDVTEKAVEFWNQNGAYIGKMNEETYNAQDKLFTPKLTGFGTFLGWFTDGNVEFTAKQTLAAGTTNAVAKYTASSVSNVTFNGESITGADTYNTEITLPATSVATTCWKRDGEIIAYGSSYKFNVWDATNITEGTEEITDRVPVAILDYSDTHKAYMLEYDAGDYEIVEAGIIFGKDTASMKTYTSQRNEKHNQFTVPEEGALDATGYIIYTLDKGASYKTKYVSVKTVD